MPTLWKTNQLTTFISSEYKKLANPVKARDMAAYMKTDMPFYGIQKPARVPIYKEMKSRFPITTRKQYEQAFLALWQLPHREEKYAALAIANHWPKYITPPSIPLYRRLIKEGAWWDFVDGIAANLVGTVWLNNRDRISPMMDQWIVDNDMWIRRSAIIGQLNHKKETDTARLYNYCIKRADEKEFFIRKAIGWALREHSYTDPKAVRSFLMKHKEKISGLSFREGAKYLKRSGKM